MQMIELIFNLLLGVMTVIAVALFMISLLAYKRTRSTKLGMIGTAFLLFFFKGVWLTYKIFTEPVNENYSLWIPVLILDTVILLIFYVSALKR